MKPEIEQVLVIRNVEENKSITVIRKNENGDQVFYHAAPMSADEISRFLSGRIQRVHNAPTGLRVFPPRPEGEGGTAIGV